ncbi:MAG TPA: hypothetical protein VLF59_01055 [Candidatus Saccharimonadales bacterium]|nr:hypothetical protein [Candidatus Saccharimonadales bacterium]
MDSPLYYLHHEYKRGQGADKGYAHEDTLPSFEACKLQYNQAEHDDTTGNTTDNAAFDQSKM